MQVSNHNIERCQESHQELLTGSVTHSTRIECHRFSPTVGRETLVFYPDGSWVYRSDSETKEGYTKSQTIATLLQAFTQALEIEDEDLYAQTYATASHWHLNVYFHSVLVKRESAPVLPRAVSHLSALDQWLQRSLGLTHAFFTSTKREVQA